MRESRLAAAQVAMASPCGQLHFLCWGGTPITAGLQFEQLPDALRHRRRSISTNGTVRGRNEHGRLDRFRPLRRQCSTRRRSSREHVAPAGSYGSATDADADPN